MEARGRIINWPTLFLTFFFFEFLSAGSNNNPNNDGEGQARKDDIFIFNFTLFEGIRQIDLVTVFDAMLTSRQTREKLQ